MPIKVFVVDDSAVVRQVLTALLTEDRDILVTGTASDPIFAMQHMRKQWPDVIILDVEMPRMDGIAFLKQLMRERPTPVVMCSSLTENGAVTTMQAMAAGAVNIVAKPKAGIKQFLHDAANDVVYAVKVAAQAKVSKLIPIEAPPVQPKLTADVILPMMLHETRQSKDRVVAIGTSTGGTQALESVLTSLPLVSPGLVIVQHMPEKFTEAFAARLNSICRIEVKEAQNGDRIELGRALIAPGGRHSLIKRNGDHYYVEVVDGPLVCRHRPSVDVLFRSAARYAGKNALGIIMTGMGDDGARGLKEMFDSGAETMAQDEASCVVYGMPKEAVRLGAVGRIIALSALPAAILKYASY